MKILKNKLIKKLTLSLLSFILCISLIIPVSSLYTTVQPEGFQPLTKEEFYGRNALSNLKNGQKYVTAYDRIVDAIANLKSEVSIVDLGITVKEINCIRDAVLGDPIDDFWLGVYPEITFTYYTGTDTVVRVKFNYADDLKNDLANKKKLYDSCLQAFIDTLNITPGMSEAEIVLEVHDKLASQIYYSKDWDHYVNTEFGSIVEGMAKCDGYAYAFTSILAMYGIQSFSVLGVMDDDGSGHAWNIIRIDGKYYECDLTWNDNVNEGIDTNIYYWKYNITSEEMLSDRSYRDTYIFDLPNCTATDANYYLMHPEICLSTSSPLEAFAALEKDGFIRVYMVEGLDAFVKWGSANINKLAALCGFDTSKELTKKYSYENNEYHIYISGPRIDESQKPDGDKNNDGVISYDEFYGRCSLAVLSDGSKLLEAYDRIYNSVAALDSSIDLSDLELTHEQYKRVFYAYRGDPTGHFWLDEVNCQSFVFTQTQLMSRMTPAYFTDLTSDLDSAKERYSGAINSFIEGLDISEGASEYDITLAVHDALAMKASEYNSANTHSPYYLMVENIGRCHAYCHSYTEILASFGISAFTIYGQIHNANDNSTYRHSWVLTYVDGTYCYTDILCDDKTLSGKDANKDDIYYTFYNVDAEQLGLTHSPVDYYPYFLPENISGEMSYFEKNPYLYVNESTSASVYAAAEKDGFIRVKYSGEDPSLFEDALEEMQKEIAKACGYVLFPECPVSYDCRYGEYHIYIEGIKESSAPERGDVDCDGRFSAVDSNMVRRLIAGTVIADYIMEYACDVNGDGAINAMDSNAIRRILSGAE